MLSKIIKNYLFLVVGFSIAFTFIGIFSLTEISKTHSDKYTCVTGTVLDTWSEYNSDTLEYYGRVGFTINDTYHETVITNISTNDEVVTMWVPKDFTGDSRSIVTEMDISSSKVIMQIFGVLFVVATVIFFWVQINIYYNKIK